MKAIIIEDEAVAVRQLIRVLQKVAPTIEIVETLESIESAVYWFSNNAEPDLIFLDIHLSDGLSFEIFNHVKLKCPIIFTTAYDEYAIQAFKVNSIDYLLKPIKESELAQAIEKYKSLQSVPVLEQQVTQLLQSYQQSISKNYKTRFLVKKQDQLKAIESSSVSYFYSEDKITFLRTASSKYIVNYSLNDLEKMLNPNDFFRLNRKMITSFSAIQKIHKYFNGKLLIELSPAISEKTVISREKAIVFKEWLGQ